jgi:NADPH:quinone reductase-like Zn-dependent oxidoreductase
MPIPAEGWFIYAARPEERGRPAELVRERYELSDLEADEVLLEPLFASWEANIQHAIAREPVDTCALRKCQKAIVGNAGVARVLAAGKEARDLEPGRAVLPYGIDADAWGYPERIMGFDSLLSGLLTTRLKLRRDAVVPLPENTRFPLRSWAAFHNRYVTAWANWRVAYGAFRLLLDEREFPRLNVWSWGGGTGLAEVELAALLGHRAAALSSRPERLAFIRARGVEAVDRGPFAELQYDEERYRQDPGYRERYRAAEEAFLETVRELTGGAGVQIFVDSIGAPVFRATTKALGRHGVLTTVGWKGGMRIAYLRAVECIARHQFVHTHFARPSEARDAVAFAEEHGWVPETDERVYTFDEVPELAARYAAGDFRMYPVCSINPE